MKKNINNKVKKEEEVKVEVKEEVKEEVKVEVKEEVKDAAQNDQKHLTDKPFKGLSDKAVQRTTSQATVVAVEAGTVDAMRQRNKMRKAMTEYQIELGSASNTVKTIMKAFKERPTTEEQFFEEIEKEIPGITTEDKAEALRLIALKEAAVTAFTYTQKPFTNKIKVEFKYQNYTLSSWVGIPNNKKYIKGSTVTVSFIVRDGKVRDLYLK